MVSTLLSHRLAFSFIAAAIVTQVGFYQAEARAQSRDIVDTAIAADGFETLVAAVSAAGLVDTLKGDGPFTVFAPSDRAFENLPAGTLKSLLKAKNKSQLQAVLTYHVVPGKVSAREAFGLDYAATVNGQRLPITRKDGKLVVSNASILSTDIQCSNGVIHVIDQVLLPQQAKIPEVADAAGQFSTLLAAVGAAGLAETLSGDGPFTVLAPTDDAFGKLPEGTVDTLLKPQNREKLAEILKFHVLSGRVYSEDAVDAGAAKTVQGQLVSTSVTADGLLIGNATVLKADLETANGVIHVIDTVLLPAEMDAAQAMRTLKNAISRGVPIYNHGNHSECADIYAEACQSIVDSAGDEIPGHVVHALRSALNRAGQLRHSGSRAWALRHGMDSALHGLGRMTL
jgi:uncharacterized surface protein with fasciclin (FAS1) repeats